MSEEEIYIGVVMDRFAGGLLDYIETYFHSINGTLYKPVINYTLPDPDYVRDNWNSVLEQIQSLKPIKEYTPELKAIAAQYLLLFFDDFPDYRDEECLKL